MVLSENFDAESYDDAATFAAFGKLPAQTFQSTETDAERLLRMADDMEGEADMTHSLEAARILRGAAHKVRMIARR